MKIITGLAYYGRVVGYLVNNDNTLDVISLPEAYHLSDVGEISPNPRKKFGAVTYPLLYDGYLDQTSYETKTPNYHQFMSYTNEIASNEGLSMPERLFDKYNGLAGGIVI